MAIGEQPQSRQVPAGLAGGDGFPWSRLVLGLIAVLLSATTSWRAARQPVEPVRDAAPALALPRPPAAALALHPPPRPPQQQQELKPPATLRAEAPLAAPVEVARAQPRKSGSKGHLQRVASHAKRAGLPPRHKPVAIAAAASRHGARASPGPSRAELRREYIALREQVAAFTGEDSGSAYLARLAAHQGSGATDQVAQARGRHQARHAASSRS